MSACIQIGITGLKPTANAPMTRPDARIYMTIWDETLRIFSWFPAPYAEETMATTATPIAEKALPISQLTDVVRLTELVAAAPRRPTMAVSTYWSRVVSICSSMTGMARTMRLLKFLRRSSFSITGDYLTSTPVILFPSTLTVSVM